MRGYIIKRFFYMLATLLLVSILCFIIIQLPPGDFLSAQVAQLAQTGAHLDRELVEALRVRYGLDKPMYVRYLKWISGFPRGDFGASFKWNMPVTEVISKRLPVTIAVSLVTLIFTYIVAIPIGIYSATNQYSIGDYVFTVIGFIGLATPSFLIALVIMVFSYSHFGLSVGGLFSPEYIDAAWNWDKLADFLQHLIIPVMVVALSNTAGLIRTMRSCLLDELGQQYVITARAKGVSEIRLLIKYPIRLALNPIVSSIGWVLPSIVSGATLTSIVLGLPTMGPVLFTALLSEDMYLAGTIILIESVLVVFGMFISDILLAMIDPRIRYV
jgi:peptide/nickel transport system permease protein